MFHFSGRRKCVAIRGRARPSTTRKYRNSFRGFDVNRSGRKTSHESERTKNNIFKKMFPWACRMYERRAEINAKREHEPQPRNLLFYRHNLISYIFFIVVFTQPLIVSMPSFPSVSYLSVGAEHQPTWIVCEILKRRKNEHLKMKILATFVVQAKRLFSCENGRLRVHVSDIYGEVVSRKFKSNIVLTDRMPLLPHFFFFFLHFVVLLAFGVLFANFDASGRKIKKIYYCFNHCWRGAAPVFSSSIQIVVLILFIFSLIFLCRVVVNARTESFFLCSVWLQFLRESRQKMENLIGSNYGSAWKLYCRTLKRRSCIDFFELCWNENEEKTTNKFSITFEFAT